MKICVWPLGRGIVCTLFCLFLIAPLILLAEEKEIPITTSSEEALKLFLEGREKRENLQTNVAAELFDQAVEKDPEFAVAYLYRAYSGRGFEDFQKNMGKAVSLIDKVSEGEKHWILAYKANSEDNGPEMKKHLDHLLKLFPSDKRVHLLSGFYYNAFPQDREKALQCFQKAIELDDKFATVFNQIGYLQITLGNYEEAEEAFKTYIKLLPDSPNPYDSYAEFLQDRGRYDESIEQYQKAIEKDPLFTVGMKGIGNNYVFLGDYEKAREYYKKWFEKAPVVNEKLSALYWQAVSYVHEGKTEEALKMMDKFRALGEMENIIPTAINAHLYTGFILTETGNTEEGLKILKKAGEQTEKSDLPEATKEYFTLYTAMNMMYALSAKGEFEAAASEAEKCQKLLEKRKISNEEQNFYSTLGHHEVMKGDYDKALECFAKGNQQHPMTMFYRAVAYEKKGNKEEAMKSYKNVAEHNVNSLPLALVRARALEKIKE